METAELRFLKAVAECKITMSHKSDGDIREELEMVYCKKQPQ
jgi:hypothetical protein